jgi:hypothetical protein
MGMKLTTAVAFSLICFHLYRPTAAPPQPLRGNISNMFAE